MAIEYNQVGETYRLGGADAPSMTIGEAFMSLTDEQLQEMRDSGAYYTARYAEMMRAAARRCHEGRGDGDEA